MKKKYYYYLRDLKLTAKETGEGTYVFRHGEWESCAIGVLYDRLTEFDPYEEPGWMMGHSDIMHSIVVVTKSDLLENAEPTNYFGEENVGNRTAADFLIDQLEKDYDFLPYAPVVLTSSETGENVTQLFELALEIDKARHTEVRTVDLNKILNEAIVSHPPAGLKNTRPKPKYIVQTDTCPPWFVVHGHDLGLLHWSWKRFLERKIREKYPFVGTPIMFSYRSDNNRDNIDK